MEVSLLKRLAHENHAMATAENGDQPKGSVSEQVGQARASQKAENPSPTPPAPKSPPKPQSQAKKAGKAGKRAKKSVKPKALDPEEDPGAKTGGRLVRSFPACTFEEALEIANGIQQHASTHAIRRRSLF